MCRQKGTHDAAWILYLDRLHLLRAARLKPEQVRDTRNTGRPHIIVTGKIPPQFRHCEAPLESYIQLHRPCTPSCRICVLFQDSNRPGTSSMHKDGEFACCMIDWSRFETNPDGDLLHRAQLLHQTWHTTSTKLHDQLRSHPRFISSAGRDCKATWTKFNRYSECGGVYVVEFRPRCIRIQHNHRVEGPSVAACRAPLQRDARNNMGTRGTPE